MQVQYTFLLYAAYQSISLKQGINILKTYFLQIEKESLKHSKRITSKIVHLFFLMGTADSAESEPTWQTVYTNMGKKTHSKSPKKKFAEKSGPQ